MKKVAVIMGSDSDLPIVEKCIEELKKYEIPTEVHVYSAHRTPDGHPRLVAPGLDKVVETGRADGALRTDAHPPRLVPAGIPRP